MSADAWLFQVARSLVMDMPTRPAVRVAAYRMLAGLMPIRAIPHVTDPYGRPGTAIALTSGTQRQAAG